MQPVSSQGFCIKNSLCFLLYDILSKSLIICAKSPAFIDCWNVLVIFAACDLYLTNSDSAQLSIFLKFLSDTKLTLNSGQVQNFPYGMATLGG